MLFILNNTFCNYAPLDVSALDTLFGCWIEDFTLGLLMSYLDSLQGYFTSGVPGIAPDCPCGVWCHGITTCFLYVDPLLGNLV